MGKRYEDWKPGDIVICLKDDSASAPVKRGQRLTLKSLMMYLVCTLKFYLTKVMLG